MYKTNHHASGCFRNGIERLAVRHALNSSPGMTELFITSRTTGVSQPEPALPLMYVVLKSICNMKQKNVCKRWSATSPYHQSFRIKQHVRFGSVDEVNELAKNLMQM